MGKGPALPAPAASLYISFCVDMFCYRFAHFFCSFARVPSLPVFCFLPYRFLVSLTSVLFRFRLWLCFDCRHDNIPYGAEEREGCNVFFVWEMLRPLLRGAALFVIPDDIIYDPQLLGAFVRDHAITRMLFTPSLLEAVLECPLVNVTEALGSLTAIVLCGEVVTVELYQRASRLLPATQLWNLYSISECHDVTCINLSAMTTELTGKYCPVGSPIYPEVCTKVLRLVASYL